MAKTEIVLICLNAAGVLAATCGSFYGMRLPASRGRPRQVTPLALCPSARETLSRGARPSPTSLSDTLPGRETLTHSRRTRSYDPCHPRTYSARGRVGADVPAPNDEPPRAALNGLNEGAPAQ